MAYDLKVATIAYNTAVKLNASNKVIVALFEAGIVESGFRNLTYGDRDSIGFLQQRPSQGWGSVSQIMNVEFATTSFVNKAKAIENNYSTSGKLAQGVQRSAYPDKYDKVETEAKNLIKKVGNLEFELILPVEGATEKNISSKFGEQRTDHVHGGLDIAMPLGSKVFTIFGGVVYNIGFDSGGYGNFVIVLNPSGTQELFAHLSKISVRKNDNLSKGQKIGEVGSTGNSTGNHLHYEIRTASGTKVDPLTYLKNNSDLEQKSESSIIADIIKKLIGQSIASGTTLMIYLGIIILIFVSLIFIFNKQKELISKTKKAVNTGISFIPGGGAIKAVKKVGVK